MAEVMNEPNEEMMGKAAVFGEKKFSSPANFCTPKQTAVLIFLWNFYEENDQLPPCSHIAAHFKFSSTNAAYEHLDALRRRGWIEKNVVGKWKFTRFTRHVMEEAEEIHAFRASLVNSGLPSVSYRVACKESEQC